MTVSVDIEVGRRANALTFPSDAVLDATGRRALGARGRRRARDAPAGEARLAGRGPRRGARGPRRRRATWSPPPARASCRPARARGARPRTSGATMNPLAPFEWIVAFRFMREGLTQTLLIVFGVALGVGVIIFMSALLAGHAGEHHPPHAQLPGADRDPRRPTRSRGRCATAGRGGVAAQVQPRSQQLRSVDQWQKVRADSRTRSRRRRRHADRLRPRLRAARRGDQVGDDHRHRARDLLRRDRAAGEDRRRPPRRRARSTSSSAPSSRRTSAPRSATSCALTTAGGIASTLTVIGIFDFGNKGVNERNVYVALRTAQSLLDLAGGVSSIEVKVHDPFAAEDVAQTIRGGDRPRGRQLDHAPTRSSSARWRRRSSPTR